MLKYSILSLFTKFNPFVFQLKQNENFSVLECEIGFWEFRLGILRVLGLWSVFIRFIKLIELGFTEFVLLDALSDVSLDVLLDILLDVLDYNFCFKWEKKPNDSIWNIYKMKYLLLILLFHIFFINFVGLKLWVYTLILKKLSLKLVIHFIDKILLLNFLYIEWKNSLILALIHECIPRIKFNLMLSKDVP